MNAKKSFVIACFATVPAVASAATVQVLYENVGMPVLDNVGDPLFPGADLNGDGDLIQIGYFSLDTASFSGQWTAISGIGSSNPDLLTSIGDGGDETSFGVFSSSVVFDDSLHSGFPAAGTQLAIRFYNGTSEASSTHFNTVTSSEWVFVSPSTPPPTPINLDLDGTAVLSWQDALNPFATTILIPEPATAALGLMGGLFLLRRRR